MSSALYQCQLKRYKTGWRHRFRDSERELAPALVSHDCFQKVPSRHGRNEAPSTARGAAATRRSYGLYAKKLSLRLYADEQMHAVRPPPRDG